MMGGDAPFWQSREVIFAKTIKDKAMNRSLKYESVAKGVDSLGTVVPRQLAEEISRALGKLSDALGGDVSGFVAHRLQMSESELCDALAAEQVDGVALAMYHIEKRSESVIIGDQTDIGKGRQAAAMIRYGLLWGYLPIFLPTATPYLATCTEIARHSG